MRTTSILLAALLAGCSPGTVPTGANGLDLVFPDADGDGIMDHHEGDPEDDADGDGVPNYLDLDSDGDGIPDAIEAGDDDLFTMPFDTDGDGVPDFLDLDSDGNCIPDAEEGLDSAGDLIDTDGDGVEDFRDLDNDGDGILDTIEIGPDCAILDSDGDGVPDYMDIDSDGDGIGDIYEAGTNAFNTTPRDTDGDGVPDYLDHDSDGDGLSDTEESGGLGPLVPPRDTDGDGIPDFRDPDSDGDGVPDYDEVFIYGTDHLNPDTDGDGFTDGAELAAGSDPLDASSVPEGLYVTVPEREDIQAIFPFELSIKQADIAFLIDTTCSMSGTLNAMKTQFSTLIDEIIPVIPDARYGAATFDDYNFKPPGNTAYGSGADKPFILRHQISSDSASVQSALNSIGLHNGNDGPESAVEALYQALTGNGYDQNCNGSYDSTPDVSPFIAHPGDAFGGTVAGNYSPTVPGTGDRGGMGFRDYALPVIVYATDAEMRNPAVGYGSPGGCAQDADHTHVVTAASNLGAYLIGIRTSSSPTLRDQTLALANLTGSHATVNGQPNTPLVFDWVGSNAAAFRSTIVSAINDLVQSIHFNTITLEIEGDDTGMVIGIDPPVFHPTGAVNGDVVAFTLTFRGTEGASQNDTVKQLTLNVIGDGTVLLDSYQILVVVPGTSL